jgi:hypothetical protein
MADYTGTPNTTSLVNTNGIQSEASAAQVTTIFGAGKIKTPTKNFTLNYGGLHLNGFKGVPLVCDTALLAALAATGAPVV